MHISKRRTTFLGKLVRYAIHDERLQSTTHGSQEVLARGMLYCNAPVPRPPHFQTEDNLLIMEKLQVARSIRHQRYKAEPLLEPTGRPRGLPHGTNTTIPSGRRCEPVAARIHGGIAGRLQFVNHSDDKSLCML